MSVKVVAFSVVFSDLNILMNSQFNSESLMPQARLVVWGLVRNKLSL